MIEKQQIDWQQLKQHLGFLYSYKMDIPLLEDKEKNADMVITRIIVKFLQKYSRLLRLKYTFIVDYRNDAYSFLAYRIIRSAASAINSDIDLRILGEVKTEEEKNFFKNIPTIGWRKAKKHKKAVIITAFNPIYNVSTAENFSNIFIEVFNPLEYISPYDLETIQDFYIDKDSSLYIENIGRNSEELEGWYEFYERPLDETFYPKDIRVNDKLPIVFFLSGTEYDFPAYDEILKCAAVGEIVLYVIPEGKEEFVKGCLAPHVPSAYLPNKLNTVTEETAVEIKKIDDELEAYYVHCPVHEKEENNENSNN